MEITFSQFLILGLFFWSFCFSSAQSKCPQDQQYSLLQFKKRLTYDHTRSSKLISWDASKDCCSWLGVTCTDDGHVATLKLRNEFISGSIKLSSFQKLSKLSALDLSYNNLWIDETGTDPASIPKIKSIYLASCNLNKFPEFLKAQSSLWDLDLSNNKIGGEIPDWIWKIEYLRALNVSYNVLSNFRQPSQGYPFLLDALDLKNNKLQGELPKPPRSVIYLDFSGNGFNSVIPVDFGSNLKRAQLISLANNKLRGSIPASICSATLLKILNLSNNALSGTVPPCLYKMASLKDLNLKGNRLTGKV